MRRHLLTLFARDLDDLTDAELMSRMPDELWYMDLCLDTLHRLPSEIDAILPCSEYTRLKARAMVKRAMDEMQRKYAATKPPPGII